MDCISYLFEQAARDSRSLQGRLMTRLELARTRRYEGWLVSQFDRVLVTSDVDRRALLELAEAEEETRRRGDEETRSPSSLLPLSPSPHHLVPLSPPLPIAVLPNGVDLDYFTPDDAPRDPATVLFSGKMSYHANVTAALHLVHDIMPSVWKDRPEVKVIIAGKDPPSVIRNLQFVVRNLEVTGAVPDLRPYLRRATVAVAPMPYGAGIQNKALEAMACATPVVASARAVSALETTDGEDLLVAGDAETFARHILRLLADPALARRLGLAGRHYVEQHHDWNAIGGRLADIYRETIALYDRSC